MYFHHINMSRPTITRLAHEETRPPSLAERRPRHTGIFSSFFYECNKKEQLAQYLHIFNLHIIIYFLLLYKSKLEVHNNSILPSGDQGLNAVLKSHAKSELAPAPQLHLRFYH